MPYKVEVSPAASRDIRRLSPQIRDRLSPVILALAEEPRPTNVRKLHGSDRTYRVRVGDFRIVYEIYDNEAVVVLLQVGRRHESFYRRA